MRGVFGVWLLAFSGGAFAALVAFKLMQRAIGGGAPQAGPGNYASMGEMYDDLDPNK